jgi:hypothetical protein
MNSSQGAPVHTGAALGCSFCCGRGEVAQKTKKLYLAKVLSDAGYMTGMAGKESNWVQTMPGKSFNLLYRMYGPLEPWFDKTWKQGDFERVE